MNLPERVKFKYNNCMAEMFMIHPILLMIFSDFSVWAHERNLPVVVTRVIDEKIPGVSVSTTHQEGRGIDVSAKGWTIDDIGDAVLWINEKFADMYGAFSYSDGKPRVAVAHHGTAFHLHLQCRRFR